MILGECDCCTAKPRVLHHCEVTGIETYACAECQCGSLCDDIDELEGELEYCLSAKPESGEAWARICEIEAALVDARKDFNEQNGQFGVGA
jgi:hypothetical protein